MYILLNLKQNKIGLTLVIHIQPFINQNTHRRQVIEVIMERLILQTYQRYAIKNMYLNSVNVSK